MIFKKILQNMLKKDLTPQVMNWADQYQKERTKILLV